MKLYLIGLPGSGKSFLGKKLAAEVKVPFIDLDKIIEHEAGTPVAQIFSEKGEGYFRSLEATALRQQSKNPEFVMACGGGTPCFLENMSFIKLSGKSIFLNPPLAEIVKRFNSDETETRPLLAGANPEQLEEKLKALLEKRISFYNQADFRMTDVNSRAEILALLKR